MLGSSSRSFTQQLIRDGVLVRRHELIAGAFVGQASLYSESLWWRPHGYTRSRIREAWPTIRQLIRDGVLAPLGAEAGIEGIAQRIAKKIEGEYEQEDRESDKGHFPPDTLPKTHACAIDHQPPRWLILNADPEKAHENLGTNGGGKTQGEGDDDDVEDVGQDMAEQNTPPAEAQRVSRLHIGLFFMLEHFAANQTAKPDPCCEANS